MTFKDKVRSKLRDMADRVQRSPGHARQPTYEGMPIAPDTTDVADTPKAPVLLRLLKFCLIVGIGIFAFSNIKPYIDICGYLGQFFLSLPLIPQLVGLPIFGWLLTTGAGVVQTLLGIVLWAILQLFELLPSIMMNNPDFLLAVIAFYRMFAKLQPEAGDNAIIRSLKAQYNSLPTGWIETAHHYRAIAYIIDALLCLAFYPPIKGGWSNIGLFAIAPSLNDVDWANLLLALSSLFLVEVLYHGYRFVSSALYFFAVGSQEPAQD